MESLPNRISSVLRGLSAECVRDPECVVHAGRRAGNAQNGLRQPEGEPPVRARRVRALCAQDGRGHACLLRGTIAAAASAAALCTSGNSVTYWEPVKLVRECPSIALMIFVSVFAAS